MAYGAEVAAGNTALDQKVADLSRNEPDLTWLVLDLAFVLADAAAVIRAFNAMRQVARALRDTGDLGAFSRLVRAEVPGAKGDRLINSAAKLAAASAAQTGGRRGSTSCSTGCTPPIR